ncbi:phosphodiester glycosidase family protein [Nocardioides ungokensis]
MSARFSVAAVVLACALAGTAPALAGAPPHQPSRQVGVGQGERPPRVSQEVNARQHRPWISSDGDRGQVAPSYPSFLRADTTTSRIIRRQVAPGVQFTRWDQRDARGPIRAYLLTVDPTRPGVHIDVAAESRVSETAPVKKLLGRDHAVAGVNGDFYDIGDTGAPLGVARDRQRGLLNARQTGWNSAFYLDRAGRPELGTLALRARVAEHPDLPVTNLNSPFVKPDGIGIYTPVWGRTAGYRVTDGQTRHVRVVTVRDGRVRSSGTRLRAGKTIDGTLLIGRGDGADALRQLKVGSRASIGYSLPERPQVAITGSRFLVKDGLINVVDDRTMAPRTAVGIDHDTGEVLILAIDGRQSFSRGYTMVELANMMIDLGADDALNLDGGGSTTMVARKSNGSTGVVNSPSDGFERSVANALEVTYTRP